jgi:hypothetical protein
LSERLEEGLVLAHPFVVGEIACGSLRRRAETLALLGDLMSAPVATHLEALRFIDAHRLAGRGIGFIDVHLLASTTLAGARLWTRDKSLAAVASELRLAHAM